MRHLLCALVMAATGFAQDDVKKISPDELKQLIGPKVFFLDVRTPKEIEELGSVKGYVNIPIDELEKRMGEIPKDKRIITACSHGKRGARAAAMLKAKGYDVIGACGTEDAKEGGVKLVYPSKKT